MYVDNPNVITLARKLELIPNVLQVRFFSPLRERIRDEYGGGPGCMVYQLMLNDLVNEGQYEAIKSLIPAAVINDESAHAGVVENITGLVEEYQINHTLPSRLGTGGYDMINVITTSSLAEQYQPEPIATPGDFSSI